MKHHDPILIERLQELSRSNPTPEILELLWEIRRLHGILRDDLIFVELVSREFVDAGLPRPLAINMRRLELLKEPCTMGIYRDKFVSK